MNNKNDYIVSMLLIEKIYKAFLNLLKNDLEQMGIFDINNIQCLLIYQIGKSQINVSDVITKGYYSGSNVSYNIKKMSESGYIEQTQAKHDKRASIIKLTSKGLGILKKMDKIFEKHSSILKKINGIANFNVPLNDVLSAITAPDLSKRGLHFVAKAIPSKVILTNAHK